MLINFVPVQPRVSSKRTCGGSPSLYINFGDMNPPDGWTSQELQEILDLACTGQAALSSCCSFLLSSLVPDQAELPAQYMTIFQHTVLIRQVFNSHVKHQFLESINIIIKALLSGKLFNCFQNPLLFFFHFQPKKAKNRHSKFQVFYEKTLKT